MTAHPLDLQALVGALEAKRRTEGISWRELARRTGVSASTLTRMHQGKRPDVDTFSALVSWLGASAEEFLATGKAAPEEQTPQAAFAALMRSKRVKKLSEPERATLDAIVNAALTLLDKSEN
jgi:transcriptional regulator with XRE-family HTH domain